MNEYWDDTHFVDYNNVGLLILRVALGAMLFYHGYTKAKSLEGTARWFASMGLHPSWLHARMAAVTEMGFATLLAAGLVNPLACAGLIGLMTTAALTDHKGKGFFIYNGGWEYVGIVGVTAAVLALIGPGGLSLDRAFGWSLYGWPWFTLASALGVLSGIALVVASKRFFPTDRASEAG